MLYLRQGFYSVFQRRNGYYKYATPRDFTFSTREILKFQPDRFTEMNPSDFEEAHCYIPGTTEGLFVLATCPKQ